MYLFEILLFTLIILAEIPKIFVFSQNILINTFINFFQIPIYLCLVFLIIEKKYRYKQLLLFAFLGILLLLGYIKSNQAAYFRGFLLILASKDIPFDRILKTSRYAITSMFAFTVLLWTVGLSDSGIGRRNGIALGYSHPNIAAQILMIILFLWLIEKGERITRRDYVVFEGAALITYILTKSNTSIIVMACAPLVIEIVKRIVDQRGNSKMFIFLLECSQGFVVIFTWLSALHLPSSVILNALDLLVSNRIFLNYYLLNKFNTTLFGQNIAGQFSILVYNDIRNIYNAAMTCDNTYVMSALVMGLIPTAIFLIGFILVIRKAVKEQNYLVVSAAVLLAVYAFCEAQLVEVYNNFVYLYILAKNNRRKNIYGKGYDT